MTTPQAAEPQSQVETAIENPVSRPVATSPMVSLAQETAKERAAAQRRRDDMFKAVTGIGQQVAKEEDELRKVERAMEDIIQGPERDKLRARRRELLEKLEDRRMAHASGLRQLQELDKTLAEDAAGQAIAQRQAAQAQGAYLASEIKKGIADLGLLFRRYRVVEEEDRLAADVVRSLSPERYNEVPTYSYATGVDQNFAAAIGQVIGECQRSEKELAKRPTA